MKRSRNSKGVSWAHGVNLCQVKLFSLEDCPSKVGQSSNHLQTKSSGMSMSPPSTVEYYDCPPGFNVTHPANQLVDISCIPVIKWNFPPKFVMSSHWRLAAGEESKEMKSQKFREMRLLEAIYPRTSDIPPGASVSTDIENEHYNDSFTPLVPVIPIEEDECGVMESDSAAVGNFSSSSMQMMASNIQLEPEILKCSIETSVVVGGEKPSEKLPDVGVDVAAAASTALTVLMKSMEQGSMIDTNLLIKIFNDPTMIQNLTNILPLYEEVSRTPPSAIAAPISVSKPVTESISLPIQKLPLLPNRSLPKMSIGVPSSVTTLPQVSSNIAACDVKPAPDPQKVRTTVPTVPGQANVAPVSLVRKGQQLKDLNYYKNLVRQHGDQKDGREQKLGLNGNNYNDHNLKMVHAMKAENLKYQNQKRCVYFNSPKGCRNGDNCQYKHDMSYNWRINNVLETHSAKRMKLWGEVAGRI